MPEGEAGKRTILLIEDDPTMVVALRDGLQYEGFQVVVAEDGVTGVSLAKEVGPALVLLDIMLPKLSGLDVCRRIRADADDVSIIMLTARSQEIDKALGLKQGADDYVTKPFSFLELLARIEAVMRCRTGSTVVPEVCRFGEVEVRFKECLLLKRGVPVEITARELRLLEFFFRNRGKVVAREQLLQEVWGQDRATLTRTVDMHIAKLRKKIEPNPSAPRILLTVHGMGYKLIA